MVRLVRGEGHDIVQSQLQSLLGSLHADPGLDVVAATGALLGTAGDLLARLDPYMTNYPHRICLLYKKWFPDSYVATAEAFVKDRAEHLDVGFSTPLRNIALTRGDLSRPGARNRFAIAVSILVSCDKEGDIAVVDPFARSMDCHACAFVCVLRWCCRCCLVVLRSGSRVVGGYGHRVLFALSRCRAEGGAGR